MNSYLPNKDNRMDVKRLYTRRLPAIPEDIARKIAVPQQITLTEFRNKNLILQDRALSEEVGYARFEDGSFLVSMTCPMPAVTPEMIKWWFWWHPQKSERYRIWFPHSHRSVSYAAEDKAYFDAESLPDFRPNVQYPVETVAGLRIPLKIRFVTPEQFGFSAREMEENSVPLIVCGHVGALRGLVEHTEMAHIFRQTADGLFLTSRFWLGRTLKQPFLRKVILTERTAKGMAEHCCVEYRNLAEILPDLYAEFG